MIRVNFYFATGNLQSANDFPTVEQAFDACKRMEMDALAWVVGTTSGSYEWRVSHQSEHTLDGFRAKLALCCNSPAEYSRKLIDAGICTPYLHRSTY